MEKGKGIVIALFFLIVLIKIATLVIFILESIRKDKEIKLCFKKKAEIDRLLDAGKISDEEWKKRERELRKKMIILHL